MRGGGKRWEGSERGCMQWEGAAAGGRVKRQGCVQREGAPAGVQEWQEVGGQ